MLFFTCFVIPIITAETTFQVEIARKEDDKCDSPLIGEFGVDLGHGIIVNEVHMDVEFPLSPAEVRKIDIRRATGPKCKQTLKTKDLKKLEPGFNTLEFICKGNKPTNTLALRPKRNNCLNIASPITVVSPEDLFAVGEWGEWSQCSCPDATQTRSKQCVGKMCDPTTTETEDQECPCCEAGYEYSEEDEDCIDIDECGSPAGACAENAVCVNTAGSYECSCDLFGDGHNICIEPRACHPGGDAAGCVCQILPLNVTTLSTSWNNTDNTCSQEYSMEVDEENVHSWNMVLDFDREVEISEIWRANTDSETQDSHTLHSKYFNVEKVMSMNYHISYARVESCQNEHIPSVALCTEEIPEIASSTTTTSTQAPTEAPTEAPGPVLGDMTCGDLDWSGLGSWAESDEVYATQYRLSTSLEGPVTEWSINLKFDNAITSVETWNAEVAENKDGSWTLTSKDYNPTLEGNFSFTLITKAATILDGDQTSITAVQFCSQPILSF